MEHRHLDPSGLRVPRLTVGATAFGGLGQVRVVGQTDPEGAQRRVNRGLDALRRLGTDHIDLYHVHDWDGPTPREETPTAFEHLVRSGTVRYVGCSHFGGWLLARPGITTVIVGRRTHEQLSVESGVR